MKLFKRIKKRFQKTYICPKCNDLTFGNDLCILCTEYDNLTQQQKKNEIEAKEDLKRRDWIRLRDEFLKKNG